MKTSVLILLFFSIISLTYEISNKDRLEFLNNNLKEFNSPLIALERKDGTIGLFARKKIKKNSEILKLPESMLLSSFDDYPRSYFFYEMGGKHQIDMLAGHLLFTKYLERGVWNYDYFIKHFNKESLEQTAGYWNDDEYQFFLTHLGYYPEHYFDRKDFQKKLRSIKAHNEPHLDQYKPEFPAQMFEFNELLWAYSMINKYSFPLSRWQWYELHGLDKTKWRRKVPGLGDNPNITYTENIPGFVMIPFLDLISYESIPFKGKYRLSELYQVDNQEIENYFQSLGIVDPKTAEIEIKGEEFEGEELFDLLYFDNLGMNEIKNLMRINKRKFTLLANKDYQKGEEIRYLLNKYSNHDYLANSGQLVPNNYFDYQFYTASFPKFQPEHFNFCYEIDCAPENTTEFTYRFHRFQANHRFIKYLRILVMVEDKLRGENETPNPFDLEAARRVISRGYFNSPYREILVWKYYFQIIAPKFRVCKSTIVEDREALKHEKDELKRKMIMNAIQQKEIAHRHVQFSLQKWSKVMLEKLLLGQIKLMILGMVQKVDRSKPGFFTYSPLE